jgi:hypothetical protein
MASDLSMYLAPARVLQAQEAWFQCVLEILGERREQNRSLIQRPIGFPGISCYPRPVVIHASRHCGER